MRASLESLSRLEEMGLPRNAKDHDIGEIHDSFERFGYIERVVLNEETGHIISGHGRVMSLLQDKRRGIAPPEGVVVEGEDWLVPSDWVSIAEGEEEAAAIALNRLVERGGWDEPRLAEVLSDLAQRGEEMLRGIGFDSDDLDELLARLNSSLPGIDEASDDEIAEQWMILIECSSEQEQAELLDQFTEDGIKCRALVS